MCSLELFRSPSCSSSRWHLSRARLRVRGNLARGNSTADRGRDHQLAAPLGSDEPGFGPGEVEQRGGAAPQ